MTEVEAPVNKYPPITQEQWELVKDLFRARPDEVAETDTLEDVA